MENHLVSSGNIIGKPLKSSVKSTSSEQLISFLSNPFEIGGTTDDALNNNTMVINNNNNQPSPLSSFPHDQTSPSPIFAFSTTHLIDRCSTNSSSCENFRNHHDLLAPTLPNARLAKASSANPIPGCHDDSLVPPIPPRDYFAGKQKLSGKHSNIHPILRDGHKLSNTHYWLLPDKQTPSENSSNEEARRKSDYVNFKEVEKNNPNPTQTSLHPNTRQPKELIGRLACGLWREDDDVSLLGEFNREGDGCDNNFDIISTASSACNVDPNHSPKNSKEMSMCEAGRTMEVVRERVDGVTLEECQTVLSMCGWDVERAVEYLKVENLFRLGIASRHRCKLVLQANQWDLARAASDLVDFNR